MSLPITETIAQLANSAYPLLSSRLVELSNLGSAELVILEQTWADIEPERRRQIISRLVELAEDNIELDFNNIFTYGFRDQDAEIRCRAIEGLWENEEPVLITPLLNLLGNDSSEKVQAAAATSLGRFTLLAEHDMLRSCHKVKISQALLGVIDDDSKGLEVRRRALESVSSLNLPQVSTAIKKAYQSGNFKLRVSAIYAMGKNCETTWLPLLLKELTSSDAEIRYEVAVACGELREDEAVPSLIKLVADSDTDVRLAAIRALGRIGGNPAKGALEGCRNTSNEAVRQAAEQALDELEVWEHLYH